MRAMVGVAMVVALAACVPPLADSASPGAGWPDLIDPPVGRQDGRADAAVIVVLDDVALGGRPGAWEVGSGWWRYLVHTRGLRKHRVKLLRNEQASGIAIRDAIIDMKQAAGTGSMLWFVYIGAGVSPDDDGDGLLGTGAGLAFAFAPLRALLGVGSHESAFILLDACADEPPVGYRSGIPAHAVIDGTLVDHRAAANVSRTPKFVGVGEALEAALARVDAQVDADVRFARSSSRNSFVLTAGTGDACRSKLADRPWPALAYAALGGLQGWSDSNEDGWVGANELAIYAQALIPEATLEASGVDLILADVAGLAPRAKPVARARRYTRALDPGHASRTDAALIAAAQQLDATLEDMVAVPSGSFFMGCDKATDDACERDEYPPQNVELGGFAIDRTEVTWAAYRACVTSGACPLMCQGACWVWTGKAFVYGADLPAPMLADDHPVVCVDWLEAATYCEAVGKRLPTEAEWERAARGIDGRLYPWGNEEPTCKHAAISGCTDFTHPIASHPAGVSPVGAQDMAGNVAEWVFDWWAERGYLRFGLPNPTGPDGGEVRGLRGGSFYSGATDLRVSYRYGLEPSARTSIVGFRCAR